MKRAAMASSSSSWKLVLRVKNQPSLMMAIPCDEEVFVGRGDLGMDDSRYSRKQLLWRIEGATGHATVGRAGVNPAFIRDAGEAEAAQWTKMEQGREYEVQHGSMIKPLLIGPELVVHLTEEEDVGVSSAKSAKTTSNKAAVPCQYGASCYRLGNEEHCAKYSHPDINHVNRARETSVLQVDAQVVATGRTSPADMAGQAAVARMEQGLAEEEVSLESPSKKAGANHRGGGAWMDALWPMCEQPEKFTAEVLEFTDQVVVIRDKFPKAKYHFLVCPRIRINRFKDLKVEHAGLLKGMLQVAESVAKKIATPCRMGFHMKVSFPFWFGFY